MMPRYFFHAHDGVDVTDNTGTDLSDIEAAKAHAMQLAMKYVETPAAAIDGTTVEIDVQDENGSRVFVTRLVAMIEAA